MKKLVERLVVGACGVCTVAYAAWEVYGACVTWPGLVPWLELGGLCLLACAAVLVLVGVAVVTRDDDEEEEGYEP